MATKILLVDDNVHSRNIVRSGMRRLFDNIHQDVDIFEAEEGREALALVANEQFDLVMTDYYMPIMDGATVVRGIRALQPSVPILATSASEDVEEELVAAGATAFIPKPMRAQELFAAVRSLLGV